MFAIVQIGVEVLVISVYLKYTVGTRAFLRVYCHYLNWVWGFSFGFRGFCGTNGVICVFFFKNTGTLRVFFSGHDKFTCFKTTKRIFLVLLFNNTQTLRVFCKPHANFSCGCLNYKGGGSFTRGVIFISFMADFFFGCFFNFSRIVDFWPIFWGPKPLIYV